MALNTELLKQTLSYILNNPEKWDQKHWATKGSCTTAYCFAGTAVHLQHPKSAMIGGWRIGVTGDRLAFDTMRVPGLGTVDIESQAAEDLGLTTDQVNCLFEGDNTLPQILRMVAELLEDPNADLSEFSSYESF
jgi:hypothetical protein